MAAIREHNRRIADERRYARFTWRDWALFLAAVVPAMLAAFGMLFLGILNS